MNIWFFLNVADFLVSVAILVALCVILYRANRSTSMQDEATGPIPVVGELNTGVSGERVDTDTLRPDVLITQPPMVDGVTLYQYLTRMHPLKDNVWAAVVQEFYTRAAGVPEILSYFHLRVVEDPDLRWLKNHFTRALVMVSKSGITQGAVDAMRKAHEGVHDREGRRITPEIYDAVIATLIAVLVSKDVQVPQAYIAELGKTIAPLRDAII